MLSSYARELLYLCLAHISVKSAFRYSVIYTSFDCVCVVRSLQIQLTMLTGLHPLRRAKRNRNINRKKRSENRNRQNGLPQLRRKARPARLWKPPHLTPKGYLLRTGTQCCQLLPTVSVKITNLNARRVLALVRSQATVHALILLQLRTQSTQPWATIVLLLRNPPNILIKSIRKEKGNRKRKSLLRAKQRSRQTLVTKTTSRWTWWAALLTSAMRRIYLRRAMMKLMTNQQRRVSWRGADTINVYLHLFEKFVIYFVGSVLCSRRCLMRFQNCCKCIAVLAWIFCLLSAMICRFRCTSRVWWTSPRLNASL